MSTASVAADRLTPRPRKLALERVAAWSTEAWCSIAVVVLFIGITCLWLSLDRSIPVFDAGLHLALTFDVYQYLGAGHIGQALTLSYPYPPFSYLVGSLGILIGGMGVDQPIIAENLVFVPLLALGCYNVGRIAFGPLTGLLAVVIALGSPLITAQFHVFMTDAPETAMVAVSVWLLLASERFSRPGISAAAGVAVGLGMNTKEPFGFFVAGVILVMLVRGGWRSWRGLLAFAIPALIVILPWYVSQLSHVGTLAEGAALASGRGFEGIPGVAPARFSGANFTWYFWNIINAQLFAPLFAFSLVGGIWTIFSLARKRPSSPVAWELIVGAVVSWIALTETFLHDTRYGMPLLLYLAVFGSCWIERLARRPRLIAAAVLVVIAIANTLTTSFGVGRVLAITLPGAHSQPIQRPGLVTLFSNGGFLVAGPKRDGDIPGLLQILRREGTQLMAWVEIGNNEPAFETAFFSEAGLTALTVAAGMRSGHELPLTEGTTAILGNGPILSGEPPPCVRLEDGSGVWIKLGEALPALKVGPGVWILARTPHPQPVQDYCPFHHPQFYSLSAR